MDAYFVRGNFYYEAKRVQAAIEDLNIYLLVNKQDAEAYAIRGECFASKAEFSLAINDYSQAIALDATNPLYYFDRGFFFLQMQEYDKAQEDFKKALIYNHTDKKLAYFNLGIAQYKLGIAETACENWLKSEDVGRDYWVKYCQ